MIGTLELLGQQLDLAGELRDLELAGLDLLAGGHQLHVVDHDQLEVVALLEPPRLGPDLHHRHVGRVVDEHRRARDLAHLAGQLGPVVVAHLAVADVVERHLRLGGEQPHRDLGAGHLQAEEAAGHVVVDRRGAAQVERQGRLPHGGPGRDDDHLAGVQAVGQVVEVGEAGRDAVEAGLAVADRLDLVEDAVHDVRQRRVVLGRPAVGDLVDLGLRLVDDVVDLALAGVADLHDAGAGVDQPPQDRLLADDLGVVARVGRDRHVGRQRVEVGGSADPGELAPALQRRRHGDRVGRLAPAVEVDDRVVDQLVGRAVEVDAADRLRAVGDGVLGEHHRAQHALLGRLVLRRHPATAGGPRRLAGGVRRRTVTPLLVGRRSPTGVVVGDAHPDLLAPLRGTDRPSPWCAVLTCPRR